LLDFSHSVFLFLNYFNFSFIYICLYTVPSSVFVCLFVCKAYTNSTQYDMLVTINCRSLSSHGASGWPYFWRLSHCLFIYLFLGLSIYLLSAHASIIQGDQKVSVHLTITISTN
jgi:hypothetical protein